MTSARRQIPRVFDRCELGRETVHHRAIVTSALALALYKDAISSNHHKIKRYTKIPIQFTGNTNQIGYDLYFSLTVCLTAF